MAVFFIVLPFIILNANGYRFNFKKSSLQKTGIIFLESKPEKVEVWLNDKLIGEQTPIRIKNLLPNEYRLRISKDGYSDWDKKIKVNEGQTTNVQYIRLFRRQGIPQLLVSAEILKAKQMNDENKILLLVKDENDYQISAGNLSSGVLEEKWRGVNEVDDMRMIDSDHKLVIEAGDNVEIVDMTSGKILFESDKELASPSVSKVEIDEFSGNFVYFLENSQLTILNLANHQMTTLPYLMVDYAVSGGEIFFLSNSSLNKTWLKKTNVLAANEADDLLALEMSADYGLEQVKNNMVMIRQINSNKLMVFDVAGEKLETITNADYYKWNSDYTELLFGNEWEVWLYYPHKERDNYVLLTRLGQSIDEATWYNPETHVFYIVNHKQIKVIESLESNRNAGELATLEAIKNIMVNKKGDKIYFIGQAGNQRGLYTLQIQ